MSRPDLEGRLPIVYNGKSVEEWYSLYCWELLHNQRSLDAIAILKAELAEWEKEYTELISQEDQRVFSLRFYKGGIRALMLVICKLEKKAEKELKYVSNLKSFRMIVCETCGNKRCPHANDKRFECTGSNEVGQVGVLTTKKSEQESK